MKLPALCGKKQLHGPAKHPESRIIIKREGFGIISETGDKEKQQQQQQAQGETRQRRGESGMKMAQLGL